MSKENINSVLYVLGGHQPRVWRGQVSVSWARGGRLATFCPGRYSLIPCVSVCQPQHLRELHICKLLCKHFQYWCCKCANTAGTPAAGSVLLYSGKICRNVAEYLMIILETENAGQICCSVIVKINDAYSASFRHHHCEYDLTIEYGRGNNNKKSARASQLHEIYKPMTLFFYIHIYILHIFE